MNKMIKPIKTLSISRTHYPKVVDAVNELAVATGDMPTSVAAKLLTERLVQLGRLPDSAWPE
jgi:hypothetical protein